MLTHNSRNIYRDLRKHLALLCTKTQIVELQVTEWRLQYLRGDWTKISLILDLCIEEFSLKMRSWLLKFGQSDQRMWIWGVYCELKNHFELTCTVINYSEVSDNSNIYVQNTKISVENRIEFRRGTDNHCRREVKKFPEKVTITNFKSFDRPIAKSYHKALLETSM